MAQHRRRDLAASRRRREDEGDEEGGLDADDSLSEGSMMSEDDIDIEGDDVIGVSTADAAASMTNGAAKDIKTNGVVNGSGNGSAGLEAKKSQLSNGHVHGATDDMNMMLNGLHISEKGQGNAEVDFADLQILGEEADEALEPSPPVAVSSAHMDMKQEAPHERRRREHEEYKKKRDEDPAFVPNRGAFFMHDHRHAGPAANGFRPFGRGRGRGGRPAVGGPYAPINQIPQPFEPSDAPWAHDMHDMISEPRHGQGPMAPMNGAPRGPPRAAVNPPSATPLNRALSTTTHVGNVQIRVLFGDMEKPLIFPGVPVKQYTRLPDHRPPLRRDKPVRISIPNHGPRYIFPAVDRSFIFIPRALRPNQQGYGRGRGRSGLGSVGGYSRRTSVFGGSVYGSVYTPSVAMSRRSSLAREVNRESITSPNGSVMSRPPMAMEPPRPVVRLPPPSQQVPPPAPPSQAGAVKAPAVVPAPFEEARQVQAYPPPQKPAMRENRPNTIPMHQPRPQKAVSVAGIESPVALSFNPPPQQLNQPFHHQVPLPAVNGHMNPYPQHDHMAQQLHSRTASYPSQTSTGTPLSQIPERAIHAQPFQPHNQPPPQNPYAHASIPQQAFYPQPYAIMAAPQGYYYPPQPYNPSAAAPPFVPHQASPYPPMPTQATAPIQQPAAADPSTPSTNMANLVAQEVNGMVYYYDAAQLPPVATFPVPVVSYVSPPIHQHQPPYPSMGQVGGVVGMGGMMTPSPDGFYYPNQQPQVQAQPPQAIYYGQ